MLEGEILELKHVFNNEQKRNKNIEQQLKDTAYKQQKRIRKLRKQVTGYEKAILSKEIELSSILEKTSWLPSDDKFELLNVPRLRSTISNEHYEWLHNETTPYQVNNWLLSEIEDIMKVSPTSLLEFGCGNGRSLEILSEKIDTVYGMDWVSPKVDFHSYGNIFFTNCDILKSPLPSVDIICSADFLEHFTINELSVLLQKSVEVSSYQYHVIACYDDGHSHLTVMPPACWEKFFKAYDKNFHLSKVVLRNGSSEKTVCTINNFP